jgi:integrase
MWWIDLRANGRRIRRKSPVQSLEGAIEFEQRIKAQLERAHTRVESFMLHSGSTYAEFSESWMTEYVLVANRTSTRVEKQCALRSRLLPAFGHLRLSEISTNLIDAQVAKWIRAGMSIKRANNLLTILRRSIRCAVEWGLIDQMPVIRHHQYFQPVPQYLTRAESRRLLDAMESGMWKTFIRFLLGTGVRFGEAAALKWDDLDLDTRVPTVTIQRGVAYGVVADPKTQASRRTIVLIPELVITLRAHRYRRPKSEWVFTSPTGKFYRPTSSVKVLKRACKQAGIPVVSWHKLRHSCASQLLARGVPLPAIKEVLGHTSLEVTSIYTHIIPGLMKDYMYLLSDASMNDDGVLVSNFPVIPTPQMSIPQLSLH